jgi:drug/metabolite transporter (DMT)-like permease
MLWILLSLGTALFSASEAALTRHGFEHTSPSSAVAAPLIFSLPLFALTLPFLDTPQVQPEFWSVLIILVPINAAGFYLQTWSFKSSPLSLTVPFMAFTPAFVLLTGFLYLGERPSAWGCAGVLITVIGGYILYADGKGGVWAPFKAILHERGSMLMLGAALVWSVASVMGKQLILLSSPLYAGCVFSLSHNVALLILLVIIGQIRPAELRTKAKHGLGLGLCLYLHILCHFAAVSMTTVAYMLSIKRLNGLFALGFEHFFFGQPLLRHRLHGTAWMTAGAVIIAIMG